MTNDQMKIRRRGLSNQPGICLVIRNWSLEFDSGIRVWEFGFQDSGFQPSFLEQFRHHLRQSNRQRRPCRLCIQQAGFAHRPAAEFAGDPAIGSDGTPDEIFLPAERHS
jgi:hypothetical protein